MDDRMMEMNRVDDAVVDGVGVVVDILIVV